MEYNEHGFLEELLIFPSETREIYNGWNLDCFQENPIPIPIPPNCSFEQNLNAPLTEFYFPFGDEFSAPDFTDNSSNTKLDTPPFPTQEDYSMPFFEEGEPSVVGIGGLQNLEFNETPCKMEPFLSNDLPAFEMGFCEEKKSKVKKIDGQPSKNLMAERRRRKRLNDRLSMLRSVVPKISKMDRTSILGDTIDYMKELLERINNLQEEIDVGSNQLNLMNIFKDVKPSEVLVRNSPKFDVERRNMDTRIEISCGGKPGLLLSTVNTLEALGLEIQQCVISSFNDFSMQASCSEELEQRSILSSEVIKQALFRNAGYGGRCL